MELAPQAPAGRARDLERAHALLLALPALVLAWPYAGAPLAGDLQPALSGTGWAALAALPAAVLLLLRGSSPQRPATALLLAFLAAALLARFAGVATDTQETSRAAILLTLGAVQYLGGASLGREGRAWLAGALVALTWLLLVPALTPGPVPLAGALGNTGPTAQAALPGALVGALVFARGRGALRWAGVTALLLGLYVGAGPVLAGAVALALALASAWACAPRGRWSLVVLALLALAAAAGGRLAWRAPATPTPAVAGVGAAAPASDLGGVEVRKRVWSRSLVLLSEHKLRGVGPGQFAAAFPPYRDPAEIELSSLGRKRQGQETEVEHAHNDWLQAALDTGVLGGIVWVAFLLSVAVAALRALRSQEAALAGLAAAALALLVNALLHAPLLYEPAPASVAFALFGVVLARPGRVPAFRGRLYGLVAVLLLASQAARARAFVHSGRALARVFAQPEQAHDAVVQALERQPDAVLARSLLARFATLEALRPTDLRPLAATDAWEQVLALRPHRFEAWMELGRLNAMAQRFQEARAHMQRARALDPGHPRLLRNLALLEFTVGDVPAGLEAVEQLRRDGRLTAESLEAWGASELQQARLESGNALLSLLDERFRELSPDQAFDLAKSLPPERAALAHALRGCAHLTWARKQAEAGDLQNAVRSYRQALQNLRAVSDQGRVGARVELEFAAVLLLAGRKEEGREVLDAATPTTLDLARLPAWAGDALMKAGWLGT